jgi:lysophospholipase L1-like esterase
LWQDARVKPPPLPQAALWVTAIALGLAIAECGARLVDGGAAPRLGIFRDDDGRIEPVPGSATRFRHPTGRVTRVDIDADGCRAGGANGGWLAVGDSQVLGQGVEDDETFEALASAAGVPIANGGVPGFGVEDALARAEGLAPATGAKGVLVFVNQLNDWEEAGRPVTERLAVRGGYLVTRANANSFAGQILASPLGRSHVVFGLLLASASPPPPAAPAALRDAKASAKDTDRIARAINSFAADHPELRTVAALLPADIEAAPSRAERSAAWFTGFTPGTWTELRATLTPRLAGVTIVDLTPALTDQPDAFLDSDTHLSPKGHRLVADALTAALR